MPKDILLEFMKGFSGARDLYQRAIDNKSYIELVCLGASVIDASLRIGINIKHQIDTNPDEILSELLQQEEDDKILTEKAVYDWALKDEVIDADIHEKLYELYEDRNRVIHRYIISEITTQEVHDIARDYYDTFHNIVKPKLVELEDIQKQMGIGMTADTEGIEEEVKVWLKSLANEKHGF